MKILQLSFALLALIVLGGPAEAWTVTHKARAGANGAHSTSVSSQTYTAGNLIVAFGFMRMASSTDVIGVSGSVSGAFSTYQCPTAVGSNQAAFIAYKVATGGAEIITAADDAAAVATSIGLEVSEISGGLTSSPEDAGVRFCSGAGSTTSPTVTSGAPSNAGQLFVSVYGSAGNVSGFSFTEDLDWTNQTTIDGNTNLRFMPAYRVNAGTGTLTRTPTTSASGYAMPVIGFLASAPPPSAPACRGKLSLLGVGC